MTQRDFAVPIFESLEPRLLLACLPAGAEVAITAKTALQNQVAVARDAAGDYVAVWTDANFLSGSGQDIVAQRYHANGTANGAAILVNQRTTDNQYAPSVAMDDAGDFAVAWRTHYTASGSSSSSGDEVMTRLFAANGTATTGETAITEAPENGATSIAMDEAGSFVVAWDTGHNYNDTIQAQRFNTVGQAVGAVINVATDAVSAPDVAMDATGDFVVAWTTQAPDQWVNGTLVAPYSVAAQRYDATGAAQGATIQVNSTLGGMDDQAAVGMDDAGNFAVAWTNVRTISTGNAIGQSNVLARRFLANGTAVGRDFQLNSRAQTVSGAPDVAMGDAGDFYITWTAATAATGTDTLPDKDWAGFADADIYAERFNARGTALEAAFRVNTTTAGNQFNSAIATDAHGNFVVAWTSDTTTGHPTYGLDVFAQRFPIRPDLTVAITDPLIGNYGLLVPGDTLTMNLTVTNSGAETFTGPTQVGIYASNDAVIGGDTLIGTVTTPGLNLATGGSRTFTATVRLPSTLLPNAAYHLVATVDPANTIVESNEANNAAIATKTMDFEWEFGTFTGHRNTAITVVDGDGTLGTFSMSGPGSALLTPVGGGVITMLTTGTTSASTMTITTNRTTGDGRFLLDTITVPTSLGGLSASTTDLTTGLFVTGGLRTLSLGDVAMFGTISDGTDPAIASSTMTFRTLTDTTLTLGTPVASLTINQVVDPAIGTMITTPWIGRLAVTGNAASLDLTLSGVGAPRGVALGSASIGGDLTSARWNITGGVGTITIGGWLQMSQLRIDGDVASFTAGGMHSSLLFAGVNTGLSVLPTLASDFTSPHRTIASFAILGLRGQTNTFANSDVAAWTITWAGVTDINTTNGGTKFGLAAGSIGTLLRTEAAGRTRWTSLTTPAQSFAIPVDFKVNIIQAYASGINLGTAGNFTILAKSGISTTGTTSVVGDIGVSPIAATAITGFGLTLDASGTFSTSSRVSGKVYASTYAAPTPTYMTTAISDMETAYTAASAEAPGVTELHGGNIGGLTLASGVYKWGTNVTISTNVTLSGGAGDVWVFQIAGNLMIGTARQVILSGGAQASNIFWQVAGDTDLEAASHFEGIILDATKIVMKTGATLDGKALAQTAVTLDSNGVG